MEMTQPRRDTPAHAPQVDRVRDAMRDHDERQDDDDKRTEGEPEPEPDDMMEPDVPGKQEHRQESGES
jgi:hypothetical protein